MFDTIVTLIVLGAVFAGVAYIVKRRKPPSSGTGTGDRGVNPPSQQK